MPDSPLIATLVPLLVGAVIGVLLDRIWRRYESRMLFRIQVGLYEDREGHGRMLTITNVGLIPVPEYKVWLFHPQRGSLGVFRGNPSELVFPQLPEQKNCFSCGSRPRQDRAGDRVEYLKTWFLTVGNKAVSAPSFTDFRLRLVMRNSEVVLFEDEGLGNDIAKKLYEDATGKEVEQEVKPVYYRSTAPFWLEIIRKRKIRKMIRTVEKETEATN